MSRPATAPHGSRSRYQRGGCRCELCRARNAEYQRDYRASRSTPPARQMRLPAEYLTGWPPFPPD